MDTRDILRHLVDRAPWRELAACRDEDPDLFFYGGDDDIEIREGRGNSSVEQVKRAKSVCRSCPVQADCLAYALTTSQRFGIWGGATARERKNMKRKIQRRRQQS